MGSQPIGSFGTNFMSNLTEKQLSSLLQQYNDAGLFDPETGPVGADSVNADIGFQNWVKQQPVYQQIFQEETGAQNVRELQIQQQNLQSAKQTFQPGATTGTYTDIEGNRINVPDTGDPLPKIGSLRDNSGDFTDPNLPGGGDGVGSCGVGFTRNASGVCVPSAEGTDSELIDPRSKTGLNVPGNWLRHLRGLMLGGISGNIFGGDRPSTNLRTIRSSLQRRTTKADERRRRG